MGLSRTSPRVRRRLICRRRAPTPTKASTPKTSAAVTRATACSTSTMPISRTSTVLRQLLADRESAPSGTTDARAVAFANSSGQSYAPPSNWVAAPRSAARRRRMQLSAGNNTLRAKKSWFMFDDESPASAPASPARTTAPSRPSSRTAPRQQRWQQRLHCRRRRQPRRARWSPPCPIFAGPTSLGISGSINAHNFPGGANVQPCAKPARRLVRNQRGGATSPITHTLPALC